jgi:hypothetical protein
MLWMEKHHIAEVDAIKAKALAYQVLFAILRRLKI